jgi:putative tryptophan/tyrosine transport system permease protein
LNCIFDCISVIDSIFYNGAGLAFVTLGLLVSVRYLGYPDLTGDASFAVAACVYGHLMLRERIPEPVAAAAGVACAATCGVLTALLNMSIRTGRLICAILVATSVISILPLVLQPPLLSFLGTHGVLGWAAAQDRSLLQGLHATSNILLWLSICGAALSVRLGARTRVGILVRYLGSVPRPMRYLAHRAWGAQLLALGAANALVGLGGLIEAQRRAVAHHDMGAGIVLLGIAALLLGESIIRVCTGAEILSSDAEVAGALVGCLAYAAMVECALRIVGADLRLSIAVLLIVALAITHRRRGRPFDLF